MRAEKIRRILFPKKVSPLRLLGFRLFHIGGRTRWLTGLFRRYTSVDRRMRRVKNREGKVLT